MTGSDSLTMRLELVGARFAGRWPRWQDVVVGVCHDPPDESLFDRR